MTIARLQRALDTELGHFVKHSRPSRRSPAMTGRVPLAKENCQLRVAVLNPEQIETYTQAVAGLLEAQVKPIQQAAKTATTFDAEVAAACAGHDLVIFGEPGQSWFKRRLLGSPACQAIELSPTSLLVARRPRWPLKKILLIIRSEETNDAAINWAIRLARPGGAEVTVLPVVPPLLPVYNREVRVQQALAMLLATDTVLSRQMWQVIRRLGDEEIEGSLRLRQGTPIRQIRTELAEEEYDLIVVTAEPEDWWVRRLLGELVGPLLDWADRPVLIAKR